MHTLNTNQNITVIFYSVVVFVCLIAPGLRSHCTACLYSDGLNVSNIFCKMILSDFLDFGMNGLFLLICPLLILFFEPFSSFLRCMASVCICIFSLYARLTMDVTVFRNDQLIFQKIGKYIIHFRFFFGIQNLFKQKDNMRVIILQNRIIASVQRPPNLL